MSSKSEASCSNRNEEMEANTSRKSRPQKVFCKHGESEITKLNRILFEEGIRMKRLMTNVGSVPKFNKEKLIHNCLKWMGICCNVDDYYEYPVALNNLKVLIVQSAEYSELNGPITYFLKTKFFAKFFKNFITLEEGWKCVELCTIHYKGACGVYHDRLKDAAAALFEKRVAPKSVARVYALLPMTGEGGSDGILFSNRWNIQFEEVLKKCNSILRDLLKDVVECQTYPAGISLEDKYCSAETITEELLYTLFCNYCNVLRYMLLCSFPATKCLMPQRLFNVIFRCLNVSRNTLGSADTTRKIKLFERLPKFHIMGSTLLKALILVCKTQLLPYSFLLMKIIYQSVQLTDVNLTAECNEMCLLLRISAYDNWMKWTTLTNGAGAVLSSDIASSALHDLTIPAFIEKPEDDDPNAKGKPDPDAIIRTNRLRRELIIVAVNVLTVHTRILGCTVSAEQLKDLQMFVVDSILKTYHTNTLQFPYSAPRYRYGLYCLLKELVNCRAALEESPINWAIDLFRRGIYDSDAKVANFCSSTLPDIQNIIDQEVIRTVSEETD